MHGEKNTNRNLKLRHKGTHAVPETYTKRQVTQHGCLPSLPGGGDKGIEMEYGEEKNMFY